MMIISFPANEAGEGFNMRPKTLNQSGAQVHSIVQTTTCEFVHPKIETSAAKMYLRNQGHCKNAMHIPLECML